MSNQLNVLTNLPAGQSYVCLSFLSDEKDSTHSVSGVRVGGVFDTYEAACNQAKAIQEQDDRHHVFVGETGHWLPFDPDPDSPAVKDSEYANQKLNEIMKGHKENMERARVFHEIRKTEGMMDNVKENLEHREKTKTELTEKLSKVKSMDEAKTLTTSLDNIEEQMKNLQSKLNDLQTNDSNLREELEGLGGADETNTSGNNIEA